ncbi:MAG: hypothetical protein U1A78_01180 [Polyangia bacterium]
MRSAWRAAICVVLVLGTLGAAAVGQARADPGPPRIIDLSARRILILSPVPLRRAETLVIRSPSGEDCGLLVLDTVEPRAGGWLGVGAQRSETRARLGDTAYPVGESSLPDGPPCTSRRAPTPAPGWTGVHRAYVRVRPYIGFHRFGWGEHAEPTAGVVSDLGAEANTASGFRIGVEIAPLNYIYERPQLSGRLHLGYANEVFALSLGIGNGLSWYYPQISPIVRLGRLDGTYAVVRISWALYPPRPIPMDLDVDVNVRIRERWRWNLNVGGGYGNLIGIYATTGAQLLLGGTGLRGTTVLGAGLGIAWVVFDLGPALSLGVERRF